MVEKTLFFLLMVTTQNREVVDHLSPQDLSQLNKDVEFGRKIIVMIYNERDLYSILYKVTKIPHHIWLLVQSTIASLFKTVCS